jgi:hypothetical protein
VIIVVLVLIAIFQLSQNIFFQNQSSGYQKGYSQLQQTNNKLLNEIQQFRLNESTNFTIFEELQFITAYATTNSKGVYVINFALTNTGTTTAVISSFLINGQFSNQNRLNATELAPGATAGGAITLPEGDGWTSGMNVNVTCETVVGNQYSKEVPLP